jgi:hypothetical protein
MIIAWLTIKTRANYMSKKDFDMLVGYNPMTRWNNYEEYFSTIRHPIDESYTKVPYKFDTDDIEVAKFLLTKVEGLVEVHNIQVI